MLLAFVAILVVGALMTLTYFVVLAATSARSAQRAVAGAQAQLMPSVTELRTTAQRIAERVQRLRPQP